MFSPLVRVAAFPEGEFPLSYLFRRLRSICSGQLRQTCVVTHAETGRLDYKFVLD